MRVIAIVVALLALESAADAYPQFQFSTGTDSCGQCHFAPGGGGLLTEYGRDEAGSTISMKEGNGGFLHGAWTPPENLQIGGDIRGVLGWRDNTTDAEVIAFPMQAELYVRPHVGPVSVYATAGPRPSREGYAFGSREHYLMYEPEESDWYLRAGRFFPVFGIRTQDHTAYPRRHMQMYVYEEPYGVAYGTFGGYSELHISAFTRAPRNLGTAQDHGVAAYYEKRNEDATAAYALQTKLTVSATDRRGVLGGVYKRWMEGPKLLLMAEADAGVQAFDSDDADPRFQALGYLGVTYFAKGGVMLGAVLQAFDEDLLLKASGRHAAELNVQWFPYPHFEIHLLTRAEAVGFAVDEPAILVLSQLHYYL
jgi:hypothetical protein